MFSHEPSCNGEPFVKPTDGIDPADSMKSRNGKQHERSGIGSNTMGDFGIGQSKLTELWTIEDQFTAPVGLPFIMEVGHQCEAPDRSGTLRQIFRWRGIIMRQQTIARPIRVIVKIHMSMCDMWERFDIRSDARHR